MDLYLTYIYRNLNFYCLRKVEGDVANVHKHEYKREEEHTLVTELLCQVWTTDGAETERQSEGGEG